MKIWFVVAIFGTISATGGPLPYDMSDCLIRLAEKSVEMDHIFAANELATGERMRVDGRQITRADVKLSCIQSDARPELGKRAPTMKSAVR